MIRSVRRILTALMTERTLDDDQLHTFLLEAESILNSRPLTPITTDADGLEPLRPNHLLKLSPTGNFPLHFLLSTILPKDVGKMYNI